MHLAQLASVLSTIQVSWNNETTLDNALLKRGNLHLLSFLLGFTMSAAMCGANGTPTKMQEPAPAIQQNPCAPISRSSSVGGWRITTFEPAEFTFMCYAGDGYTYPPRPGLEQPHGLGVRSAWASDFFGEWEWPVQRSATLYSPETP